LPGLALLRLDEGQRLRDFDRAYDLAILAQWPDDGVHALPLEVAQEHLAAAGRQDGLHGLEWRGAESIDGLGDEADAGSRVVDDHAIDRGLLRDPIDDRLHLGVAAGSCSGFQGQAERDRIGVRLTAGLLRQRLLPLSL